MTAASKLSLKPCRKTQQGFHARKSVAAQRGKVFPPGKVFLRSAARFFRPGKCSCAARQGFPNRKNVPHEPGKLFLTGKMSLGNRARFSRPGKCSSETDDEYASWDVTYYMNGNLLNRLPQIKKLKWREVFCFRGLWGHLTDKNNPTKERNEGLYRIPDNTYRMNATPYMETSVGIENILKFLRIDYVWRLNYRNHSNIQKSGIRMTMSLSF